MAGAGAAWLLAETVAGCSGNQSTLDPEGNVAGGIAGLFWLFTGISVVILAAVVAVLIGALLRRREEQVPLAPEPARERRMGIVVGIATGASVVILIVLTLSSYLTTRGFGAEAPNTLRITVTGKQWWWQVQYEAGTPADTFVTANEIHVPVGQPVALTLLSNDVIHSFWVPNIAGKLDLIPGRTNRLRFTATKPGNWRGQCAEYCGLQHAHMSLVVVAQTASDFAAWRAQEHADAAAPAEPDRAHGLEVFLRSGCVACHAIRGTEANGLLGPDLTHIASRTTIAAGTLPNTRGNLQGWIADPQGIKPGALMPRLELSAGDLNAVSGYLAGLK